MRFLEPSRRSPGLLRVKNGAGAAIEVEVWALSEAAFGRFVAAVPRPLSIGTLELADGCAVKGFLVEAEAVERRARYFKLRRLARFHGAGNSHRLSVVVFLREERGFICCPARR